MEDSKILVVPASESGQGGGHIARCVNLVGNLRMLGRNAWLHLPQFRTELKALVNEEFLTTDPENNIKYIILDRFKTPADELAHWKKIAPVVGIDEGGSCRDDFDFLIDMLVPKKLAKPAANIYSPALLNTAKNMDKKRTKIHTEAGGYSEKKIKILISFGHEDRAGLGLKSAKTLSSLTNLAGINLPPQIKSRNFDITLLCGGLSSLKANELPNVRVLETITGLADHLCEYDLVITHYGITAYESLFAGIPVVLLSPTAYHAKLAKAAGFYHIRHFRKHLCKHLCKHLRRHVRKLSIEKVALHYKKSVIKQITCGDYLQSQSLAELCGSFSISANRCCPVCKTNSPKRSTARFNDRTYRRCPKCGIIYMDRINPAPIEYEKEYFFESYKKQYGKTYLEDFENIKEAGMRRVKIIKKLICKNSQNQSLLDIGCAYGPFLSAAKEQGFIPTGIEPAEDAALYVQQKLGFPVIHAVFPPDTSGFTSPFDVITLWYVIEHFKDCASVLAEIKKILKPGGILAFSTPSYSGISGRKNLKTFLLNSPADHYTVWSPDMVKKALIFAGFKVKKIVTAGHHPERFPIFGKFADKKNILYRFLLLVSRIFSLGDTFEVFAQLKEDIS